MVQNKKAGVNSHMQLATSERFNGTWYTHYYHHSGFAKRAQLFVNSPGPILVVGSAFGFLVDELVLLGKTARGIDASDYAITNRTSQLIDSVSIISTLQVNSYLLTHVGGFGTVITEDVLTCLTDAEAVVAAAKCSLLGSNVVHLVSEPRQVLAEGLNFHSLAEWEDMTGQGVISLEGM